MTMVVTARPPRGLLSAACVLFLMMVPGSHDVGVAPRGGGILAATAWPYYGEGREYNGGIACGTRDRRGIFGNEFGGCIRRGAQRGFGRYYPQVRTRAVEQGVPSAGRNMDIVPMTRL